ncbi:dentin sialophospho protein [Striga asiatica]|uniref:Dentin sialophospho protein n=1 Tax=Striga asiatica TaxID=4170 RepID=A0A5A7R6Q2_STRAF|nr:dentin sialophospho protein [Striga asiatica]
MRVVVSSLERVPGSLIGEGRNQAQSLPRSFGALASNPRTKLLRIWRSMLISSYRQSQKSHLTMGLGFLEKVCQWSVCLWVSSGEASLIVKRQSQFGANLEFRLSLSPEVGSQPSMPGNEFGDRVHNFFAQDNSSQRQHQSRVLEGNWPVLNSDYWVGSQRQIDVPNPSSKDYLSQNSEFDRGPASYPVHVPHGLNFSQSNLRPDTSKAQYGDQQYSNGVVYGNQFHQNRQNEGNFLAVDMASNQHLLSGRGLSFAETQQGSGHEQEKTSDRSDTSMAHVSLDLFGGQQQMNHEQASMLQALHRQQTGLNDMQQMQQQIMMRKMQEFQMQQQLKQLGLRPQDLVNQVPTFTKPTSGSQPNMVNDSSNSDALQYPWTADSGTSWLNGPSAMKGSPVGFVFPQNMAPTQRLMDFVPQQDDQSLYGVPVSSSKGLAANQYPQMVSSRSSMPQVEAISNSLHGRHHNFLSDQIGVQESNPISRPKVQIENIGHASSQSLNTGIADRGLQMPKNEPQQRFAGRKEPPAQLETSNEKSTQQFSSSPREAALDPTEEKILYGSDDNIWAAFGKSPNLSGDTTGNLFDNGGLSNGFPSIQSGSWSALMQSAVAETSSSDVGLQEEWSGLNFHSNDGASANQPALVHNDYVKKASLPEEDKRIPPTLNSGSVRSSEDINSGNALGSNQIAHKFQQESGIRVSTDASQRYMQSLDESSKWSNRNTQQKLVAEGSQIYENASPHSLDAERTNEKVSATWFPRQAGTFFERNGWNAQAAVPRGGDGVKNQEAQLPAKLQNNRLMVMQDVNGSSSWKSNSPSSAIDFGPVKVGNHLADKELLSLNHASASVANSCNMGVDDGNSSVVPNNSLLNQWKNAYPLGKFQGSNLLGSNQGMESSNKSNKDEVRRLDMENFAVKENSSDSLHSNLSQHGLREVGLSDACDSRSLPHGKQKLTNQHASKVSVPRKFQYHPMGNLDEDVEPTFGLKQPMQLQPSSLQNAHFGQANQVSRYSSVTDEGEHPKDNKRSSYEPIRGSFPGSASRISFPFNRPLDTNMLNKASSPSQNMLELLHKVDQSRNDGGAAHLSSSDCNVSSQPPEAEKSDGSAGYTHHSSSSKGFGLQLGPPSQRVNVPDLSLPSQSARDVANSMHTGHAGGEMRDKMIQASSVQSSPFSNEGSQYENHRSAGPGNLGDESYKAPGNYQQAPDTQYARSQLQNSHNLPSYGGIAGASDIQESGQAATASTRNQIHSSQHFGMPGNSQQVLQDIWNNIPSSQHSLASQYPKAPSHLSAPHQPNIVESSRADLRDSKGDHVLSGLSSIYANTQGEVDEEKHRSKESSGHVGNVDSTSKGEESLGKTSSKDNLEEFPVNSASTQKDMEAFGRSLKPNAFSNNNYALLDQMRGVKDEQTDPSIRVSKRMKGPDNLFDVHQFHPGAGQQNEGNVGNMMGSSTGVSSEDSRMFRLTSSDMMQRNTAPHGNIAPQDIVVAGVDASQNNRSDCTTTLRAENHQVAPQMAPSWFNQYGHFKNGEMFPVCNAHNVNSIRPNEPSSTVVKTSSIMDAPSLEQNSPAAPVGACQVGSTLKSAPTLVTNEHLSRAPSLQLTVTGEHKVILRPQKRKTATSELHPWSKEISDGSQNFLVLSATEGDWSKAANRLAEKVRDDAELNEDGSPLLRSKRRLILTTQLMQQLFRPPPASILSADSSSAHESVTYGASRVALGDACSVVSCSSDFGRHDCLDRHSVKCKLNGDPRFAKVIEELLGKARKLEDDFLRSVSHIIWSISDGNVLLDKNASVLDLRVECQELEKFSVINRFARFHGRSQNDNAESSLVSTTATTSNPHMQRYVLALPMSTNPPDWGIMVETLKQSCMDFQLFCTSPLPWIWVIETLACSDQVDTTLLLDLLERTPEISDDHGKNARELVSLRILESLFIQGARGNPVSSTSIQKIRLDPSSDSCEDVLQRILTEDLTKISPLHLKPPFPEMSKWDLQPFIQYKKSSLTRHALEKVDGSLKNAVRTGGHSFLASLKERSGLKDKKEPEHGVTGADDGNVSRRDLPDENIAPLNRKRRATSETEDISETHVELVKKNKHDIISHEQNVGEKVISAADDAQLADKPAESVKHSEGRRCSLGTESCAGDVEMDRPSNEIGCTSPKGLGGSNDVLPCEKRVLCCDTEPNNKTEGTRGQNDDIEGEKGDEEVNEVDTFGNTDGENDDNADITTKDAKELESLTTTRCRDQNMAGTYMRDSGEERCSLGKEADVEVVEQSIPLEDVNDMYTSLQGHVTRDGVLPHDNQAQDLVPPCQNGNSDGEERQGLENENPEGDESVLHGLRTTNEDVNQLQPSVLGNLPNIDENEDVDMSTDSDGCHDERTNIATQKQTFLSSQCTYSQDSLATTDWRGLNLCVKCNLGGKLLVCGSDSCPLVIHQSCLGSDADFDTTGEFYCPSCAYSRAISKYLEIKKRTALARKDLATFFCLGTQKGSGKQSQRLYEANENNLEQNDGLPKGDGMKRRAERVSDRHRRRILEYEQPGLSEHSPPFGRKVVTSTNTQSLEEGRQSFKSQKASGEQQGPAVEIDISRGKSTSGQVIEGRGRSEKRANIGSEKGTLHSPETDVPHGKKSLRSSESTDVEETSEQENENSGASKNISNEKVNLIFLCSSYPAIPQLRRKRIPWTSEEEEKLKEGMRVHCSRHDKLIPWKKILEHGAGVFHQCRSTVDLKDKWRNLCKATPKKS